MKKVTNTNDLSSIKPTTTENNAGSNTRSTNDILYGKSSNPRVDTPSNNSNQNNSTSISERTITTTQKNSETESIIVSIKDLQCSTSLLNSVSENQKVILKIKTLQDLNELQKLLPEQGNFFSNFLNQSDTKTKPKFFEKIKELDLGQLLIDYETGIGIEELLNTISKNLDFFSGLTSLVLGNIVYNWTLPNIPNSITVLTIGNIQHHLKFPASLNNLKSLIIGNIWDKITLILPESLNNLSTLRIGDIWNRICLPNSLNNLEVLEVKYIGGTSFTLSNGMHKLRDFVIGEIGKNAILNLPYSLPSLKKLTVDKIWTEVTIPYGLNTLETLEIQFIGALLTIACEMNQLKSLIIGDIKPNTTAKFPSSLNNLEILTIGLIRPNVTFIFPENLNNLIKLTIGDMTNKSVFALANSLNSLIHLTIGNIGKSVKLQIPKTLNNLETLTIGDIGGNIFNSAEDKDQEDIDPVMSKFIPQTQPGTTITLPNSLPNLKNSKIGTIAKDSEIIGLPLSQSQAVKIFTSTETREEIKQQIISLTKNMPSMKWAAIGGAIGIALGGWFGIVVFTCLGMAIGSFIEKSLPNRKAENLTPTRKLTQPQTE